MISQLMRIPNLTIGLDLGDRLSRVCGVDAAGTLVLDGTVATDREGLRRFFAAQPQARVVLEVGTHSPWVSRTLHELGHEVLVANPSAMYGGQRRRKRNDRMDAEFLARQGRADPHLLHPIQHRGEINGRVGGRFQLVCGVVIKAEFPRKAAGKTLKRVMPDECWAGRTVQI